MITVHHNPAPAKRRNALKKLSGLTLGEFYALSVKDKQLDAAMDVEKIPASEAARIFKETGIDVSGYTRIVSTKEMRHIWEQHGSDGTERLRGQVPVTAADVGQYLQWIKNADTVNVSKTRGGFDAFTYTKNIAGAVVVVEEVRTGRKEVCLKSMYKFKNKNAP
jgi:hypothetical protein